MILWVSLFVEFISNKIKYIFGGFARTGQVEQQHKLIMIGNSTTNRVGIVGDDGVGKSTFLNCLRNTPCNHPVQTIGYDFWIDKSELNPHTKILVFYWDSGIGRSINSAGFGDKIFPYGSMMSAKIFIIVYDATWNADVSQEYVRNWLNLTCRPRTKSIVVGLRRPDQREKPVNEYLESEDMIADNVIVSCLCDMANPDSCELVIEYIKTLCRNECFRNSFDL